MSTNKPKGWFNLALVAGPLSPLYPAMPLPATVVIFPLVSILRTRLLLLSARNKLPLLSMVRPLGKLSLAAVEGPPSPAKPAKPSPAIVEITPSVPTFRRR